MHVNVSLIVLLFFSLTTSECHAEYRSYNGLNNNLENPNWGSAGTPYQRIYGGSAYADGISSPSGMDTTRGQNRNSSRLISNLLSEKSSFASTRMLSDFTTFWGQFVSVDISVGVSNNSEPWFIQVPICDYAKDPDCEGNKFLPFARTNSVGGASTSDPREQLNEVTSFIDASTIYGCTESSVNSIRIGQGGKISAEWSRLLIPKMSNPQLSSLGYLFVLEHNRLASQFEEKHSDWTDEQIFQEARRWVIAFLQKITTREYIAAILGRALRAYRGYQKQQNPTMDNFISTSILRAGHSKVSTIVPRIDDSGLQSKGGHMLLRDCWGSTPGTKCFSEGFEPVFRGMCWMDEQQVDTIWVDDIRNFFLKDQRLTSGFDLVAINIQRGRDHGIPDYNTMRGQMNLTKHIDFSTITSDPQLAITLELAYGDVNNIDAYIGALAEDHRPSSDYGDMAWMATRDQITRIRDGDRFWYENNQFEDEELYEIYGTTLKNIIERNFPNIRSLPESVFFIPERQLGVSAESFLYPRSGEYANSIDLSTNFRLSWTVNGDEIQIMLQAHATGWLGIGFDPIPNSMKDADIYLGRVYPNGTVELLDCHALDVGTPQTDVSLGGTSDILWFDGLEEDGFTTIEFRRKLKTGDARDKEIHSDLMKVIFAFNPDTDDLAYHGPTRSATARIDFLKVIPVPILIEYEFGLRVFIIILGLLGIALVLGLVILVYLKLDHFIPYTPLFCVFIALGGSLGYIYLILLAIEQTEAVCISQIWTLGWCYIVMFGCLFTKTWRVWRVSEQLDKLRSKIITQRYLLRIVGGLLAAETLYLLSWTLTAPPVPVEVIDSVSPDTKKLVCESPEISFSIVLIALKAMLLAFGVYMAYAVRNVPTELNESKTIGVSLYTVAIVGVIAIPLVFFLEDLTSALLAIKAVAVWLVITVTLVVLFIPKAIAPAVMINNKPVSGLSVSMGRMGSANSY